MNVEEIKAAIVVKGDQIRDLKVAKPPTLKEDLAPLVSELLALKIQYKEATGEDYGAGAPKEEKKKKEPEGEPNKGQAEKNRKKEERIAKRAEAKAQEETKATTAAAEDPLADRYGDAPLVQSGVITKRVFYNIGDLKENLIGQKVWIRARLATSRAVSKGVFILLRQTTNTVQGVVWQGSQVSKAMVKYAAGISLESIVDIEAEIIKAETPVQSATVKELELSIVEIHVVSRAQDLPFQVEDAGRNETFAQENSLPTVKQDTALDFRWVDTRTPANQAIFRIQSGVCQLFREYFNSRGFVEIHTPKLIGGASEGGANVFKLSYFDQPACLAQSPQFYKQMTAACGGFERVYEIGPVFRAENSNTHRHLCEFTGLDFEMAIYEHYYEVLEVMGELFNFIFDGINERYQHELVLISQQYPFEPIKYLRPPLRITFQEGITLLREAGIDASYEEDISTPHEKALGKIVKEKFGTDFYMMDKYPLSVRPFYTMPDPNDPKLSNSYDLFIRGEEIVSGAQRVHDPELLIKRAEHFNIPIKSIQSYVDAFKHGALPHGGGGIGLERVVMLFLGLSNIRKTSMFPRDPNRLAP
mmetsp:Transcript_31398/g.34279  ORF Transcript_31398/g.34279 Transcript_31398/m.34279 type:complete len:587 (+) Transcript_31398:94-1854(+)